MKVHIIGPNLLDQTQGAYHVHTPNCADMRRSPRVYDWRGGRGEHASDIKTPVEVDSLQDAILYAYGDALGSDQSWRDVRGDFKVFPCVFGLQDQTVGQRAAEVATQAEPSTVGTARDRAPMVACVQGQKHGHYFREGPECDVDEHGVRRDRLYDSAAAYASATGSSESTLTVTNPDTSTDTVTAYSPIVQAVRLLERFDEYEASKALYELAVKLGRQRHT